MLAGTFELGSGALAGLIALLVAIVILALIASRMMRRDVLIRIARIGVFVQRERLDDVPRDLHTLDPLGAEKRVPSDIVREPYPLPPPTPPPPLPPRPDHEPDEATEVWPQREEGL